MMNPMMNQMFGGMGGEAMGGGAMGGGAMGGGGASNAGFPFNPAQFGAFQVPSHIPAASESACALLLASLAAALAAAAVPTPTAMMPCATARL